MFRLEIGFDAGSGILKLCNIKWLGLRNTYGIVLPKPTFARS
jgi:hypothetical protein